MNTTATFSPATPVLRLPSRAEGPAGGSGANHAATRPAFAADLEALREREDNLRAYEERLRSWQAQLDARTTAGAGVGSAGPFVRPVSRTPFVGDTELEAAWGKLHRAHALFEAEQNQLRDERMALHETGKMLKAREAELAVRAERLAGSERAAAAKPPPAARKDENAMTRLTTAPFRAARAVFKLGQ